MIEKIKVTDKSVIDDITSKLNLKTVRDGMFPTWKLNLQPDEEYDLGTAYYGIYMIRCGQLGTTALILIGAGASSNILLNDGSNASTDFTKRGIILNKKELNGNVFVKNARDVATSITVMLITNY